MARNYSTEQIQDDIGPCVVVYDSVVIGKTGTNPDGGTHGGVLVNYTVDGVDTMRDAEGGNPHDTIINQHVANIEANFAGLSLEQIKKLMPNSAYATAGTGTSRKLQVKNPVGISMRTNAKPLIIKPINSGVVSTDPTEWIKFPLSFAIPKFAVPNDLKTQRSYKVEFRVFTDLSTDVLYEWSYSD